MQRRDYSLAELEGVMGLVVEAAIAEIEEEMRAAGTVAGTPAPARTDDGNAITTQKEQKR